MKIDFNHEIDSLYRNEPYLRPFFEDCLEINTTKDQIHQQVFFLLMHGGSTYDALKKQFPEMTNAELTVCLDKIINLVGIDVNQPCWAGEQDLMYHAMRYGTVEDVEMLLINGYDGSNLMSKETMYHNFKGWNGCPDKEKKLEKLKLYGIGDYSCRDIKEGLETAKNRYITQLNGTLNMRERLTGAQMSEQKRKEDVDFDLETFCYNFQGVESLLKEMEHRSVRGYDKSRQLMRNQKVCIPYEKSSKNTELMKAILAPFICLNKEKATSKLMTKLIGLDTSLEDILSIFQQNICVAESVNGKDQLRPAFKKFLDSTGLKYYNPLETESEDELE